MTSSLKLPCILDRESTIREWIADPRGYAVLQPMLLEMQKRFQGMLGGEEGIGMDTLGMIIDMPLDSVLRFQQDMLSMPVDELVDDLLQKAHTMEI
jgi:beta-glucosidase